MAARLGADHDPVLLAGFIGFGDRSDGAAAGRGGGEFEGGADEGGEGLVGLEAGAENHEFFRGDRKPEYLFIEGQTLLLNIQLAFVKYLN